MTDTNRTETDIKEPAHYCRGRKYEPRKVAEDWGLDKDAYLFNAFKYIARAGRKPFEGSLQMGMYKDLMKAKEYIDFRLEVLVREMESNPDGPEPMRLSIKVPEVCEYTRKELETYTWEPPYDTRPRVTCDDHTCVVADSNGVRVLDDTVKELAEAHSDTPKALSDAPEDNPTE